MAEKDGANVPVVPVVSLHGISKIFGGVHALRGVDLSILPGQVHGLLGENGSGKSTLIKILAGYHAPEPGGHLEVNGQAVKLPLQPGQFRALGISFVHQDLALIPSLSAVENLRIGELASGDRWHISWAAERRRAATVFARYGVDIDPAAEVAELSVVDRALLAIVRAVEDMRANRAADQPGLLVLDEATASLPKSGVDTLFALIREIRKSGASILFVSHSLEEVLAITDRVTVLRDGQVAGTVVTPDTDESLLVELIIGRRLDKLSSAAATSPSARVAASVEDLSGGALQNVSFEVHEGEVLGITGLVGSGFEDFPYLLFGARHADTGALVLQGRHIDLTHLNPEAAIRLGIALVPADRQNDGSIGQLSVADNVSMQVMDRYATLSKLNRSRLMADSRSVLATFSVKPQDPRATFEALSGGNQQKVILAKWIQTRPSLLLLHEPTIGVDIGARQQIFKLVRNAAATGTTVICASSDYEQLADLCDRVLIIAGGQIVSEIGGADITKERIAEQCLRSESLAIGPAMRREARGAGGTTDR